MAIAFASKVGEVATGTTTVVLNTSLTAGDYVVLFVACDNTTGTNLPTIADVTWGGASQTFTVIADHPSSSATAAAATRGFIIIVPSVSSTDTATNLTVSFSAAPAKSVMVVTTFTGVSSTIACTPIGTSATASPYTSGGTGNASVTETVLVLGLASCENTATMTGLTGTFTQPGGDGLVVSTGGGAAANVSLACAYRILAVTAGTGAGTFSAAGANDGGAVSVALRPTVPTFAPPNPASQRTRIIRANLVR